jgi:hypothetical protein
MLSFGGERSGRALTLLLLEGGEGLLALEQSCQTLAAALQQGLQAQQLFWLGVTQQLFSGAA